MILWFQKYCEQELEYLGHLPLALKEIQEQLVVQQELKTTHENNIEILSEQLKTIVRIIICAYAHRCAYIKSLVLKYECLLDID